MIILVNADLPAFTMMIIRASDFMIAYWWLVLFIAGGTIGGLIFLKNRSLAFQHFLDRAILKLPVVGQIMHNSAIARFARTLAVTFPSGVPPVDALALVARATATTVPETELSPTRNPPSSGTPVTVAPPPTALFPPLATQLEP